MSNGSLSQPELLPAIASHDVMSNGASRNNGTFNGIPKPNFKLPFPETTQQVQTLLLRYRAISNTENNSQIQEEKVAIEKVLHQVSESHKKYLESSAKLKEIKKKKSARSNIDVSLLRKQIIGFQLLVNDLDLTSDLQYDFGRIAYQESKTNDNSNRKDFTDTLPFKIDYSDFTDRAIYAGIETPAKVADPMHDFVGNYYSEQIISSKINNRLNQLEKLPSNLGTYNTRKALFSSPDAFPVNHDDLKIASLIELKSLRVLTEQKSVRQNLVFTNASRAHYDIPNLRDCPITLSAQRSLNIRPKVIVPHTDRLAEKLEQQKKLEKEQIERKLHLLKVNNILSVSEDIIMSRTNKETKRFSLGKQISHFHTQLEKDESRKLEKNAKQRLQALKANDEEAYIKLLDKTKDTRITHLLKQTNSFLDSLAQAVKVQQADAIIKHGGSIEEAATPISESATPAVEDGEEDNVDELREKIDYYQVAHRIKEEITSQPKILVGGTLKEYQLKGLQWMVSLYNNHLNGILADEMGLGKTIQSISLITYLIESKHETDKFLVIVPLSTITNWTLEFEKWAPTVQTIVYKGSPPQRKLLQNDIRAGRFQVLLTTYEYIIKDRPLLCKFKWAHMIIDEGHRMKNAQSKLSYTLTNYYHTKNRLILTGTPLQNNLPELWALLNFVLPKIFNSVKSFDEWFNTPFANTGSQDKMELTEEESLLVIRRLHKVLRPFLLRRLKKDVEKDLPDKVEKVIKCKLSGLQAGLYQQMLKHNALFIGAGSQGATKSGIKGLNNKVMQLRKICNHPFVFEDVENLLNPTRLTNDLIWRVSGKFELLDRVLPKFKASGHRVLMFFQMTQVMDIMEDFLRYKDMKYLRLDGSTKAEDRTGMLKVFNAPNSDYFCFLLSTRAGGLGLNLQTADTVIIFDTDWNPHQDLQAQDRAHRIGQKNEVRILRLITDDSVEEVILERAHQKLDIDGKVIQAGKFDNKSTAEEQEAFLKRLLESEQNKGSNEEDDELDEDELNEILARSEAEKEMFIQMDNERLATAKIQARKLGKPQSRLITEEELPAVFSEDIELHLNPAEKELGRTREKKKVLYDDGLTEEQWLDAMDDDEDTVEDAIKRKQSALQKRRANRIHKIKEITDTVAGDNVDEEEEPEEEEEEEKEEISTPRKRPARGASISADQETVVKDTPLRKKRNTGRRSKTPSEALPFVAPILNFLNDLAKLEGDDGHKLLDIFMELPSKKDYPDYFKIISKPISIKMIKKNLNENVYTSASKVYDDLKIMFQNAKTYNEEGSWVFDDATVLENHIGSKIEDLELDM